MAANQIANTDLTLGKVCSHQGKKVEVIGFQSLYDGPEKVVAVRVKSLTTNSTYRVHPSTLEGVDPKELN